MCVMAEALTAKALQSLNVPHDCGYKALHRNRNHNCGTLVEPPHRPALGRKAHKKRCYMHDPKLI